MTEVFPQPVPVHTVHDLGGRRTEENSLTIGTQGSTKILSKHSFLLTSLEITGTFERELTDSGKCRRIALRCWRVIAGLFVHFYLARCLFSFFFSLEEFWFKVQLLLESLSCALTMDILWHHRPTIWSVVRSLDTISTEKGQWKHMRIVLITAVLSIWFYIFTTLSIFYSNVPNIENQHYFTAHVLHLNVTYVNQACPSFVIGLTHTVFMVFIRGGVLFVALLYVYLCLTLRTAFASFNHQIEVFAHCATDEFEMSTLLKNWRLSYGNIRQLVLTLDRVFSKPVFLWTCMFLTTCCVEIHMVVTHRVPSAYSKVQGSILLLLDFFCVWVIFLGVYLASAMLYEEAHAALPDAEILSTKHSVDSQMCHIQNLLLISQITSPKVGITACGMFVVSKSALLGVLSALLIYTIMTFQINPGMMENMTTWS